MCRSWQLHHAIEYGTAKEEVHAELGEIVAGRESGSTSEEEIIILDPTETALQDVAAAAAVCQKALRLGAGKAFDFFE